MHTASSAPLFLVSYSLGCYWQMKLKVFVKDSCKSREEDFTDANKVKRWSSAACEAAVLMRCSPVSDYNSLQGLSFEVYRKRDVYIKGFYPGDLRLSPKNLCYANFHPDFTQTWCFSKPNQVCVFVALLLDVMMIKQSGCVKKWFSAVWCGGTWPQPPPAPLERTVSRSC